MLFPGDRRVWKTFPPVRPTSCVWFKQRWPPEKISCSLHKRWSSLLGKRCVGPRFANRMLTPIAQSVFFLLLFSVSAQLENSSPLHIVPSVVPAGLVPVFLLSSPLSFPRQGCFPRPKRTGSEHNVSARGRDNTDRKGAGATPPNRDRKLTPLLCLAD